MEKLFTFPFPQKQGLPVPDILDDILDCCLGPGIAGHVLLYLLGGVHHRRVVAPAEFCADRSHGKLGDFAHHIHGDLTGIGDGGIPLAGTDICGTDAESAAYLFDNFLDGDRCRLVVIDDIPDSCLGGADIRGLLLQ